MEKAEDFDGRKARSKVKWGILRALAFNVGVPMIAAELFHTLQMPTPLGFKNALRPGYKQSSFYNYFYRMADEGLLRLERLQDQLSLYLTDAGRKHLALYDAYWQSRNQGKGSASGSLEHDAALERVVPMTPAQRRTRRGPLSRAVAKLVLTAARFPRTRRLEGAHRTRGFISYDIPESRTKERSYILHILKAAGFGRMHASMYVGPVVVLKSTVEAIEALRLLPYVRWGTITELKR